jgi:hypothetical protein
MIARNKKARIAGFVYLMFVVIGVVDLYISTKLIMPNDAAKTIGNIVNHQLLFRLDILASLLTAPAWLALVIALYVLLADVDKMLSKLMAILVVVQVPAMFLSVTNQLLALEFAKGIPFLSSFSDVQRTGLGMLMLHINSLENTALELLWGLWLLPLGTLVYRSGFLPKFLGIWLNINGIAYVTMSLVGIFAPTYSDFLFKWAFPLLLGEVAFTLWLVVLGARVPARGAPATCDA